MAYAQSGSDNSRSLIYPNLPGPAKFLDETQARALPSVFVAFFRSPISIITYYRPWHMFDPRQIFFPVFERTFTFVYERSADLAVLWLLVYPQWGPFLWPQPFFPHYDLAEDTPEPWIFCRELYW